MLLQPRYFVPLLLAGAFLIRLGMVLAFRDIQLGPVGDVSNDDVQFNLLAVNLVNGYGYRVTPDRPLTSFRAPGFPFVLAGLYSVTGEDPTSVYVLFCLLGAAACGLTWLLARELMTDRGACCAGVLAAIYLPHAYMAANFISENVYIPCLALGLWLVVRHVMQGSTWFAAAAGLVLGFATLVRPGSLLLLPLLLGALAWNDLCARQLRAWSYLLFTLAFVGVIVPWTVRNHDVHGKWVLIATNGGTTFWGGNNDLVLTGKHLGYWVPNDQLHGRDLIDAAENEVERDAIEWQLGKDWVATHLTSLPVLELFKFARLWWLPDYGEGHRWLRIVAYVPFFLLFLMFACRCLWRPAYWTPAWRVLHLSTFAVIVTALIFCGEPRYRDAHLPVLMIYAAFAVMPGAARVDPAKSPLAG